MRHRLSHKSMILYLFLMLVGDGGTAGTFIRTSVSWDTATIHPDIVAIDKGFKRPFPTFLGDPKPLFS